MDLETDYDYLYIYDGPNTSSPLIATITGVTIPSNITSSSPNGEITIRWTTDGSNIGTWGGFFIEASIITPLPVELYYFEGISYPQWNVIKWTTASEHNSMRFDLESSSDGYSWNFITSKIAAGNSTVDVKYSYIDYNLKELTYYRLIQYDFDGKCEIFGPIAVFKIHIQKRL